MSRKGPRSVLIIEARFYEDIADELARGAMDELNAHGIAYERLSVPGALEIPLALSLALANGFVGRAGRHRGCIALGCVIRGETAHYDIVARESARKDPQFVVVDEVIGQWIALAGAASLNWKSFLAAFALFRLFDIWKPPPVRQLESLPGGWGINLDDVMAGVYAALVLWAAARFDLY